MILSKSIKKIYQYNLEILSRIFNAPIAKPRGTDLIITYRCNFKCKHCDIWQEKGRSELETKQWIEIIGNLRKWLGPDYTLSIGGGEPFLRKDIFELLKNLADNDFQVTIESNGYLIDNRIAEEIIKSSAKEIRISLYSYTPYLHNYMRGVKDAHEQAIKTLELISKEKRKFKSNIKISIGLLINKENIGKEAINLINWANDHSFHIVIQALDENFRGDYQDDWYKINPLWPKDKDKIILFFNRLIEMKKKGVKIDNSIKTLLAFKNYFINPKKSINLFCPIGQRTLNIDPSGRPFFCYRIGIASKSLKDNLPKKLWKSQELQRKRKLIKNCNKICRTRCYYRDNLMDKITKFANENKTRKNS